MAEVEVHAFNGYCVGRFQAMASPCEVLIDHPDAAYARPLVELAHSEARRIEGKFSRYSQQSNCIVHRINSAHGQPVIVDDESARLLDYADQCYHLSDGLFDVTSGVLREVWRFDGSDNVPSAEAVAGVLPRVGWPKVVWQRPKLQLPAGMEIDLGGIGKEYAVDRTAQLLSQLTDRALLVNFGGDLCSTGARNDGQPWVVGVDDPEQSGHKSLGQITLTQGGMATSGDARRFLLKDGVRYSHILDPRTGWPVRGAPRSVTVLAGTCTEAGILATFALLHGSQAKEFLTTQKVKFWIVE